MEEFYIGQKFENEYPPEAAWWCNENQAKIDEITELGSETRIFEISEAPDTVTLLPQGAVLSTQDISKAVAELGDIVADLQVKIDNLR